MDARPAKLAARCLFAAALAAPAAAQAIDTPLWVDDILLYNHRIDTIDMEGDLMVVGHTELGGFDRGVTIYERDATTREWGYAQHFQLQLIGSTIHSVHFDQGRIYVGNPQFQSPSLDLHVRDASGAFVLEDSVVLPSMSGFGWAVHADGDLVFVAGSTEVLFLERDVAGVLQLKQTLVLGTGTSGLGSTVMHTQDDWLFVSQRSTRELVVLRRAPATGLYAEHSRHPFVGDDFYLNRHNMASSPGRLLFASSGGGVVHEYRHDPTSDAWSLAHSIQATVPAPFGTEFGAGLALEGDRIVVGTRRAGRFAQDSGEAYVFDFDAATDAWTETLTLRGREFPGVFFGCTGVGIANGQIAVSTLDTDDNDRNVEVTVFDTTADANDTYAVDATEIGAPLCNPAVINFGYVPGRLAAYQPGGPASGALDLLVQHLPPNTFGYAVASSSSAFIPTPGGSRGNLCLQPGPDLGRFVNDVENSGESGWFATSVDLASVPVAAGAPRTLASGDVWYFQVWYRDGPTSNFTNAVEVTVP